ncbi:hypothetical protein GQ43DRAFT_91123 [Delitschia confertaspora ATCC 74209]|uniref:Uncharacterized protein n=1 Tax=Delitschia confertaspora ATCC 74209 TaxID=1513339 RepID=A0A9P4MXM5_9PLEO|nr:hypothetical protein GQ43DRAFT_91123 [Delitschia confertaspora ATCC 74209]
MGSLKRITCIRCNSVKPRAKYLVNAPGFDQWSATCTECLRVNKANRNVGQPNRGPSSGRTGLRRSARLHNITPEDDGQDAEGVGAAEPSGQDEDTQDADMADVGVSGDTVPKRRKRKRRSDPWTPRKKGKQYPPRPALTHYTCRICVDEKPVSDFITWVRRERSRGIDEVPIRCIPHLSRPRSSSTKHEEPMCKDCISRTFAAALETKGAMRCHSCPNPKCDIKWDSKYVLHYLPKDLHDTYHQDLFNDFWAKAIKFNCPHEGCSALLRGYAAHGRVSACRVQRVPGEDLRALPGALA